MSPAAMNDAVNKILYNSIRNNQGTIALALNAFKGNSPGVISSAFYNWFVNLDPAKIGRAFVNTVLWAAYYMTYPASKPLHVAV